MSRACRLSISIVVFCHVLHSDQPITITQTQNIASSTDTNLCTGWSLTGGTFNGGKIMCGANDTGSGATICGVSRSVMLHELTVYDPVTPANTTLVCVNNMADYGSSAHMSTLSGESSPASWKAYLFGYVGNTLYYNVYRQDGSNVARASGMIVSPDHGKHWCDYFNYVNSGNSCTSANWSATGAAPASVDASHFQWPEQNNNRFVQMVLIQACQGNNTGCPVTAVDGSYVYALASIVTNNVLVGVGIHRALKTADLMLPPSYTHWDGSTWNADYAQTANLGASLIGVHGAMWSPDYQRYLGFQEDDNGLNKNVVFSSTTLTSWSSFTTISNPGIKAEWFCPMIGLRRTGANTHSIYPFASDNNDQYQMIIQDADFSPAVGDATVRGQAVVRGQTVLR